MTTQDDILANEMAQAMYEAFPSPRRIDCGEEDFDPIPWDEVTSGARFAWMCRARNLMRDGYVLARKDAPAGAIAVIARIAKEILDAGHTFDNERLGLAWGDDESEDDVRFDEAIRVLVSNVSSTDMMEKPK